MQVDQFEAEIESLVGAAGKKKKGKSDADARSEECQQWVNASNFLLASQIRSDPPYTYAVHLIGLLIFVSGGKTPRPHTEAGDSVENA